MRKIIILEDGDAISYQEIIRADIVGVVGKDKSIFVSKARDCPSNVLMSANGFAKLVMKDI